MTHPRHNDIDALADFIKRALKQRIVRCSYHNLDDGHYILANRCDEMFVPEDIWRANDGERIIAIAMDARWGRGWHYTYTRELERYRGAL